ncbi:glycoside hydrolase family 125 protein [Listeria seeligeri]|uniref:glycoside hydrolase family 125 protein n=1 Tax=Listeria seeligeri TaxID=1640 RepID=UPI0018882360|nr:glycoside hydrolase family 125 protein [Listeria seeligeri]MBF2630189.1 glycoside hydrolase family 125 protein [Listeria seeligeri]
MLNERNGQILENNTSLDKEMMGDDTFLRLRQITGEILEEALHDNVELATLIDGAIDEILQGVNLSEKLQRMFRKCMLNTITTTLVQKQDGSAFLFTGDIPAMWLRDSGGQLRVFLNLDDPTGKLYDVIGAVIRQQFRYVLLDPYTNAFNFTGNGNCWSEIDQSERQNPWSWERKYELDSLCFPVELAYFYWKQTGREDLFDSEFLAAVKELIRVFRVEQHHAEQSEYFFIRDNGSEQDTLSNQGRGTEVGYTGMIWSGFRPSDDACEYGYLLPANMFAVVILGYLEEIMAAFYSEEGELLTTITILKKEVQEGIAKFGTVDHPTYGKIYAYEVDGLGNSNIMDDTGVPSLLSLPYIKYCDADDDIYQNTRRFSLSTDNRYYFEGKAAKGLGSPHTPPGYVWHMGLAIQGLTSMDEAECQELLRLFETTDAGKDLTHEGFLADDPTVYTREWFSWSNSIFCEFILKEIGKLKL